MDQQSRDRVSANGRRDAQTAALGSGQSVDRTAEPGASAEALALDEGRRGGLLAPLSPAQSIAVALPALFGPLGIIALRLDGAPPWIFALVFASVAPLVAAAAIGGTRRVRAVGFALAALPLGATAAWIAAVSGGVFSPATPWIFVALTLAAVMGGRAGGILAGIAALALGAALVFLPAMEIRFFGFAPRPEREAVMLASWVAAGVALSGVTWAAAGAWQDALPPLRRATVAARQSLAALAQRG
ncbi:MAG: hypothetical protein AAFV62_12005, partial [Pseudomonadota bacterium]